VLGLILKNVFFSVSRDIGFSGRPVRRFAMARLPKCTADRQAEPRNIYRNKTIIRLPEVQSTVISSRQENIAVPCA